MSGRLVAGGGVDTLDYAAYTTPVAVNLGTSAATGVANAAAGGVSGFEALAGGAGTDTLTGANAASTWTLAAPYAGDVNGFRFTGVEGLAGGTLADSFVFRAGVWAGGSIAGGTGVDTLTGPDADTAWAVSAADAGTVGGGVAFAGVENLTGGAGRTRSRSPPGPG